MSAATDALEELNELLVMEALERRAPDGRGPSDLKVLSEEIRNFADKVAEAVSRPPEVVVSPPAISAPPNTELVEALTEMRQSNRTLTAALSRPATAFPVSPPQLAPVVHVQAPTVNLSPQVTVERPTKWKFTVTKRDASNQGRIQEIIAESF